MIGKSKGCAVLGSARLSMVPAVNFYAMEERQLVAGLTEGATKE